MIAAYADFRARTSAHAWPLVLLGDGPLRQQIEQQLTKMGLESSVHLAGFQQYNQLPAYYALAGGFIHASTSEQWGLVVNEAMAFGLPILVSNRCGCAPDLVAEGLNGWTFDPRDPATISAALQKLSALSDEQLNIMGQASQEIIAVWSPDAFGRGLEKAAAAALVAPPLRANFLDRSLLWAQLNPWI